MTMPSRDRIETARLIGQLLGAQDGRDFLRSNGHQSGTPIIACEWETPVSEVVGRLRSSNAASKVTVAIRRGDALKWMSLEASKARPEGPSAHGDSTMGMLYQATQNEGQKLSIQVTNLTLARPMVASA